jgi:hypothetical protein
MHRRDLLDEQIYDRERADEFVWARARTLGCHGASSFKGGLLVLGQRS